MACGSGAVASGDFTVAVGTRAGEGATARDSSFFGFLAGSKSKGGSNSAFGDQAGTSVNGGGNSAFGRAAGDFVTGGGNSAFGDAAGRFVSGESNSAFGDLAGSNVTGDNNIAIGRKAGSGTDFTQLVVSNTVAIGTNAIARADGAVAIGANAEAARPNQFMFGTASYTYTMPGLTSDASKGAQSGPTQLVTTDALGNLASDGGFIQSQINALGRRDRQLTEGIAAAVALADPDLVAGEKFGLKLNWGNFDGSNAIGLSTVGVLGTDVFTSGDRLAVSGAIAVGTDQGQATSRVGVQLTWK
jgi:hypothetical protein